MTEQLTLVDLPEGGDRGFRPIQYLGNKWRVLDVIERTVERHCAPGSTVCDLFAGSGVVAHRLGRRRTVLAADIQEYSRVLTLALLRPAGVEGTALDDLLDRGTKYYEQIAAGPYGDLIEYEREAVAAALRARPESLCGVIEHGSVFAHAHGAEQTPAELARLLVAAGAALPAEPGTVVSRYYGGVYFSYRQAAMLDGLATAVRELPDHQRHTGLAAVLGTASDLVSTVGNQFAQPIRPRQKDGRPKAAAVAAVARRRGLCGVDLFRAWLPRYGRLTATSAPHVFRRDDYRRVLAQLPADVGMVYADPPYTRDHYSRFYHVLETLAVGDEPMVSTMKVNGVVKLSRGLYRAERHQSPFCIKSEVLPAFEALFGGTAHRGVPIAVSYSAYSSGTAARPQPRLVTIEQIAAVAGRYYRRVLVESAGRVAHSKFNHEAVNGEVNYDAETLIVAHD